MTYLFKVGGGKRRKGKIISMVPSNEFFVEAFLKERNYVYFISFVIKTRLKWRKVLLKKM